MMLKAFVVLCCHPSIVLVLVVITDKFSIYCLEKDASGMVLSFQTPGGLFSPPTKGI